jgi:tetratricopeptide (TPR) repeat protein
MQLVRTLRWSMYLVLFSVGVARAGGDGEGAYDRAMDLHRDGRYTAAAARFIIAYAWGHNEPTAAYNAACALARAGKPDGAFIWLQKAEAAGFELGEYLDEDEDLDSLRGDPRFAELRMRHVRSHADDDDDDDDDDTCREQKWSWGGDEGEGFRFDFGFHDRERADRDRERAERDRERAEERAERERERAEQWAERERDRAERLRDRDHDDDDRDDDSDRDARSLYNQGRYDDAAAAYTAEARRGRNPATALYNAACSYALAGDAEGALRMLEQAIQAGFTDLDHLDSDSDLDSLRDEPRFQELRQLAGAIELPRRARGLAPLRNDSRAYNPPPAVARESARRGAVAMYNLACAHARAGNLDEAFAWLDRAISAGFDDKELIERDDDLDPLRDDPRLTQILRDRL